MKKERRIKVCPKCNSREISSRGVFSSRGALSPNYVCLTCGLQGPLFPEISVEDAKKLPDKPRNFVPSRLPIFAEKARKHYKRWVAIAITIIAILLLIMLL